jgi:hypothetical protein
VKGQDGAVASTAVVKIQKLVDFCLLFQISPGVPLLFELVLLSEIDHDCVALGQREAVVGVDDGRHSSHGVGLGKLSRFVLDGGKGTAWLAREVSTTSWGMPEMRQSDSTACEGGDEWSM